MGLSNCEFDTIRFSNRHGEGSNDGRKKINQAQNVKIDQAEKCSCKGLMKAMFSLLILFLLKGLNLFKPLFKLVMFMYDLASK